MPAVLAMRPNREDSRAGVRDKKVEVMLREQKPR